MIVRRGGHQDVRFLRDMLHHAFYWRERDLHRAVAEARPGAVVVVVGDLEAEGVDVEARCLGEVPDAIPDRSRHGRQSASAGCSSSPFSVWRNSAPSAPSMAR